MQADALFVLSGNHDLQNLDRTAVLVAYGHLALGVRLQHVALAGVADIGQLLEDVVAVLQRGRHEGRGFVAGVAEHDALVARAFILLVGGIDTLGDVGGLFMQMAGVFGLVPVEPLLLVADVLDRCANLGLQRAYDVLGEGLVLGLRSARFSSPDLARQNDAVGGHQGLASDTRFGIGAQKRVDDGVGNSVSDLVRVTLGNTFAGEDIAGTAQGVGLRRLGTSMLTATSMAERL